MQKEFKKIRNCIEDEKKKLKKKNITKKEENWKKGISKEWLKERKTERKKERI